MRSLLRLSPLVMLLSLIPTASAAEGWADRAAEIADRLAEIADRLAAGDAAGAVAEAQALRLAVGEAVGLGVGFVTLSDPGPAGYGRFTPRAHNRYAAGEPIIIYLEPFGYRHAKVPPGLWSIDIDVDLHVFTPRARPVAQLLNFTELSRQSRRRGTEFGVQLTYTLTADPGEYVLWTTLRDRHGGGRTRFRVDVVIEDAAPPAVP